MLITSGDNVTHCPCRHVRHLVTTTVVMNTQDKIKEGQIQLDKEEHYKTLASPMVVDTHRIKSGTTNQPPLPWQPNRRNNQEMALSNTKSASYSRILHPY